MVMSPEERLQQSSSAMTAGSSQLERAGGQEAAADVPCAICMSTISDAAYVDGCLHSFCFGCIQQWAARRAVCPLCRRPFDRLLHTVRADDDYQEYVVSSSARPPRSVARAQVYRHLRSRLGTRRPGVRRGFVRRLRRQPGDAAPWRSGAPARQDAGDRPAGLAEAPAGRYDLEALRARLFTFAERQ
ncbi:E3 ubiquitin-protein ligase Topors-like [Pezoporus wallicus]|uniref:E3 ubiquitin-protein ligase Topors-like n=1 Tax=Pezoporus wallicus TaxID=35540 RepID=UPI00254E971B|nr:E3 ubiquitin-protein ligase Topors-like [Pezoporus wallicus]XP_061331730.1 E3 ubiquitin-protein ligase Topors-like [Pezoporus flaviventris]